MKVRFVALTVAAMLGIACQVFAAPVTIEQVANPGTGVLVNTKTNDIKVNAPAGVAVASMQILVNLTAGTIVENPLGGSTPPNAAFFALAPELQYDSFVAGGFPSDTSGENFDVPTVFGASLDLGGPAGSSSVFSTTNYDATYIPTPGADSTGKQGFFAARLTLSNNATGTFKFKVDFGNNTTAGSGFGNFGTQSIVNGVVVPEPATVTLLGLAGFGMVGLIGRRRSK
jgi:hypothetical protein